MPPRKSTDVIGKQGTSTTGELLKQIALKMDSIHTSRELNDRLADELKQISTKVDDHDRSLMMIAKVMEDMNSNFHEFTDTVKEMQKESSEYQKQNQSIMMKMENVLTIMSKYEPRFEKIEAKQIDGCPSSLSARQALAGEMRHQDAQVEVIKKSIDKNREDIGEIKAKQDVAIEQIKVGNNRVNDLEVFEKEYIKWKDSIYKALVTYAVSIIGALILAIWGVVQK